MDPHRRALFVARSILREVGDGGGMPISLHKHATTTPKIRAAVQAGAEPAWMVAGRHGISHWAVWTWRNRDDVHDRGHTPHKHQTTLTPQASDAGRGLAALLGLPVREKQVRHLGGRHFRMGEQTGQPCPRIDVVHRRAKTRRPGSWIIRKAFSGMTISSPAIAM